MAKVYVLSHGRACIAHRFGVSSFDNRCTKEVYDSEEKVIDHIRRNIGYRINVLSERSEYDEYPDIEVFEESKKLVYARRSDDYATDCMYYIYESYELK